MDINEIVVFAKDGERSEAGLTKTDGFPRYEKPARQWFNSLFFDFTSKINELVIATNKLINAEPYGVGDLYLTVKAHGSAAAVKTYHGYGTWQRFGEGKALVGLSTQSAAPTWTKTNSETFGDYTHTLTQEELPSEAFKLKTSSHHDVREHGGGGDSYAGGNQVNTFQSVSSALSGWEGRPHDNVQPSIVIEVWVRVS